MRLTLCMAINTNSVLGYKEFSLNKEFFGQNSFVKSFEIFSIYRG